MKASSFILAIEQLGSKKLLAGFSGREINLFVRRSLADSILAKQEIVQVFRLAGDGNTVDRREFNDLRRIANSYSAAVAQQGQQ